MNNIEFNNLVMISLCRDTGEKLTMRKAGLEDDLPALLMVVVVLLGVLFFVLVLVVMLAFFVLPLLTIFYALVMQNLWGVLMCPVGGIRSGDKLLQPLLWLSST